MAKNNLQLEKLTVPSSGDRIKISGSKVKASDNPIIVLIEGDGIGKTVNNILGITALAREVIDTAVEVAYAGERTIHWLKAYAGDTARKRYYPNLSDDEFKTMSAKDQRGVYLPSDTLKVVEYFSIGLKGPLTTPIGGGFKSINVYLRQYFDLYACVRPVRYFAGVPALNKNAVHFDMVVFRENLEDVYAGMEFEPGSDEARKLQKFLEKELGETFHHGWNYGLGIKLMSEQGSKQLIRRAIEYALDKGYKTVTLIHKGNIMKYTEGAFRKWGYELAKKEFSDQVIAEHDIKGTPPQGKVIINDRIADSMFYQIQTRPREYGVLACPNLNGDYLSDALAALVGGLGLAPGANIGDHCALFEATHGTAPKYTGKDVANPASIMLSGALMLDYIGWNKAAELIRSGITATITQAAQMAQLGKKPLPLTYDLARQYDGYTESDGAKASTFKDKVIQNMK
ncbi:isocitrate/isopropylmalate family dehydrogenase [Patescibacteria group bacterium AH-259-L07]|nr:isocitrate/isopropylmalate family dehydrogenase [Patescibacteria group bacterium AH-259-L07]